jgi:hypothetical protein
MISLIAPLLALTAFQDRGDRGDPVFETRSTHRLHHLALEVTDVRHVDPSTGRVLQTATDPYGNDVDLNRLLTEERIARRDADGKLSHELVPLVEAARPGDWLDVVFWLVEPEHTDYFTLIGDHVAAGVSPKDARQLVLAYANETYDPLNQAFADRLRAAGYTLGSTGEFCPVVFATMPAGDVRAWAADAQVDCAYHAFGQGEPELDVAMGTMRTSNVHDQGVTGASGPTAVLVNDCGEVTDTHAWLPAVINKSSGPSSHASGVAGNICADNGSTLNGAAKGLPVLYSADGCSDQGAMDAWSWGMQQGIDLGNCSWWNFNKGSIVFLDRFFDHTIRNFNVMMFKSNGNQGGTGLPYATTPGNGYNVTSTGNYFAGGSVGWGDDFMTGASSYWNPVEGHEKPELAAPGESVTTTNANGGTQIFGGTSSASPLTCGVAVLLCNQQPALLANITGVKAALMAGAWHNVEGSAPLSDKDGAGGVHATASHALVRDGQFESGTFTNASFNGGVYDKQVFLNRQDPTRIITLWFSNPDTALTTDLLDMDLDMTVLDPLGQVVASSANAFNPFEILELTPKMNGLYTIRLTRIRFNGTSEPYTIAWSSRLDAAVADVAFSSATPSSGTNLAVDFRSRYESNVPYVALLSAKPPGGTFPLIAGCALPIFKDRWTRASLGNALGLYASGFTGTLNGQGQASGTFFVPSGASWIGTTFNVTMFTHQVGQPLMIREIAPANSFTIVP